MKIDKALDLLHPARPGHRISGNMAAVGEWMILPIFITPKPLGALPLQNNPSDSPKININHNNNYNTKPEVSQGLRITARHRTSDDPDCMTKFRHMILNSRTAAKQREKGKESNADRTDSAFPLVRKEVPTGVSEYVLPMETNSCEKLWHRSEGCVCLSDEKTCPEPLNLSAAGACRRLDDN